MKKKLSAVWFVLSILIIGSMAYIGAFGLKLGSSYEIKSFGEAINRGLDLQGGCSVVYQIQGATVTKDVMDRTINLLNIRVNKMGVSETEVRQEGADKITVEVPGVYDPSVVDQKIGKTGQLKFVGPNGETILTGTDVKTAVPSTNPDTGKPDVLLTLNSAGAKKFALATQTYLGQNIDIYLDSDKVDSATVETVISDGNAEISCTSTDEAKTLANYISSGSLTVTLKDVESQTIEATLGSEALPNSVHAGEVGIVIVLLLMFVWYRRPGIMAGIALVLYVVLVLLVFATAGVTLTLAGIAAFLLTVGMAVDANVLMFARIKEELRSGKSIRGATNAGFKNALSSIVDSNINTIIAGVVLYLVGTGSVKGFALTLIIGVLVSLFTALFVTRHLMNWAIDIGIIKELKHFGIKEGAEPKNNALNIVKKAKIWFSISAIVIITGICFMFYHKGLNFGIDFKGGTEVQMSVGKSFNKNDADTIVKKYVKADKFTTVLANSGQNLNIDIEKDAISTANITKMDNDLKAKFKDSKILSVDSIGASIGVDLEKGALTALAISMIAMLLFIAFRFEFKFAISAIIALFHDVLVTLSVYAVLNLTVDTAFVAAILTIIGYSISDTIVIFDRIRENQKKLRGRTVEEIADTSISQTIRRSIYTVTTTLVAITCVHIFVPTIRNFTIPLIVGILSGCYSSIFIASPIWVIFKKMSLNKKVASKTE